MLLRTLLAFSLLTGCAPPVGLAEFLSAHRSRFSKISLQVSSTRITLGSTTPMFGDDCPTLAETVRLRLNGAEVPFDFRGGPQVNDRGREFCAFPQANVLVFKDDPWTPDEIMEERVEVEIADAESRIAGDWLGVTNQVSVALIEGQRLERPGRLTFQAQNDTLGPLDLETHFETAAIRAVQPIDGGKPLEVRAVPLEREGSFIHVTTQLRAEDGGALGPQLTVSVPGISRILAAGCVGVACEPIFLRGLGAKKTVELIP